MTTGDKDELERGGDDMLAAEYVLGVLPADERRTVADRIERDPAFARLVEAWEDQLSPLNGAYQEIDPPASVKAGLDARLFGETQAQPSRNGFLQSLAFWRSISAAAIAGLLLVLALPFMQPAPVEAPAERLVVSLASDESDVRYLAVYDTHSGEVSLSHVSGARATGRDFELWVIEGDAAPVSLGVIPVGASVHVPVSPDRRDPISSGALFAISIEPEGGSPTGLPTGPVVAAGDLRAI